MKKLVVANWKMNPSSPEEARRIFVETKKASAKLKKVKVVIAPPFVYLDEFRRHLNKNLFLGAQDVFWMEGGSYTGEVSVPMLKRIGVKYVIVGHSERRKIFDESDDAVNKKLKAVLRGGLKAILCVGEEERDAGTKFLKFIRKEIRECVRGIRRQLLKNLIVAYEPIWAIGKSAKEADSPEDVLQMSLFIKKTLVPFAGKDLVHKIPVLYGGSVTPKNAGDFLERAGVEGFLVGHESLVPEHFKEILRLSEEI